MSVTGCPALQLIDETIPALQKLKAQGKIKAIGITGYPLDIFTYVLDRAPAGSVDAILSYCHNSLNDKMLRDLLPYLTDKKVAVISASPLSMGMWRPKVSLLPVISHMPVQLQMYMLCVVLVSCICHMHGLCPVHGCRGSLVHPLCSWVMCGHNIVQSALFSC